MASWQKISEIAGYSFENGIRLHLDSINCYSRESYATAYQLSILAAEELGKAMLLEEYVFRVAVDNTWDNATKERVLSSAFSDHKLKQRWFAGSANDFLKRHLSRNASAVISNIFKGVSELEKQNSTYVGLTRHKNGKADMNGRIVLPWLFAQPSKARKHITLVNDYLLVYAEGFSRDVYATDTPDVGELLDQELVEILNEEWKFQGHNARSIIQQLKKHKVKTNSHSWFE